MADLPCKQCRNYDPIIRGKDHEARHGRCAVQSIYPNQEQPGQVFPDGIKRAAPGALATPKIVIGSEIQKTCMLFRGK